MEAAQNLSSVPSRRKALGAFYTPAPMATKLVRFAVRDSADRVFDPSFGGLVFLEAGKERLLELGATEGDARSQLYGVDLDEDAHAAALAHARLGLAPDALLDRDFFTVTPGIDLPRFQAVVGNPPYIRYQGWNDVGSAARAIAKQSGVTFTRLASSWAPFVVHSTAFVADGGCLALVLPAEMLHAQYASEVLAFVQRNFARAGLVLFTQRIFPGALEEVVLLFADGRGSGETSSLSLFEYETVADLDVEDLRQGLSKLEDDAFKGPGRAKLLAQLLPRETREIYDRLARSEGVQRLSELASVDIGVVTGANDFFLLADNDTGSPPEKLLRPAVSKATHVRGARFEPSDFERIRASGARCQLFVADRRTSEEDLVASSDYLRRGEAAGVPGRYKCRVRDPWWALPLPKHGVPELFLTYCASEHPRLVVNEAGALHTNTVHGVSLGEAVSASAFAAAFYNSLTLLSAEVVGRSYGGGVLKLEPTEAEALLLPPLPPDATDLLPEVDRLVRAGELTAALDVIDPIVLGDGLGLNKAEIGALRAGGERLRARRRARGKAPA